MGIDTVAANDAADAGNQPLAPEGEEEGLAEDDDAPVSFDGDASDHEDEGNDLPSDADDGSHGEVTGGEGLVADRERPPPATAVGICPKPAVVSISDSPVAPSPKPVGDDFQNAARMTANVRRLERLRELKAMMLQTSQEIEFLG